MKYCRFCWAAIGLVRICNHCHGLLSGGAILCKCVCEPPTECCGLSGLKIHQPAVGNNNDAKQWPSMNQGVHKVVAGSIIGSVLFAIGETNNVQCLAPSFYTFLTQSAQRKEAASDEILHAARTVLHRYNDDELAEKLRGGGGDTFTYYISKEFIRPVVLIWEAFLHHLCNTDNGNIGKTCCINLKKNAVVPRCQALSPKSMGTLTTPNGWRFCAHHNTFCPTPTRMQLQRY